MPTIHMRLRRLFLASSLRVAVDGKIEMGDSEGEDQADDRLAAGDAGTTTMSDAWTEVMLVSRNVCGDTRAELEGLDDVAAAAERCNAIELDEEPLMMPIPHKSALLGLTWVGDAVLQTVSQSSREEFLDDDDETEMEDLHVVSQ
ncbi:hypothetical protein LTR70_010052 [Exophiala xenobiotica]|uniref:Uncharacterized protein n=1 Tax=Lithohypha guttulata TaxID=1690604 RepID=A0ABR0JVN1_9EURO|nr:hypothetical protein LTR24_009971 [Lithohypha guttulata]KAK5309713.1 hypothetical protein LTR70_010052 [Exophiala xenobiotica]